MLARPIHARDNSFDGEVRGNRAQVILRRKLPKPSFDAAILAVSIHQILLGSLTPEGDVDPPKIVFFAANPLGDLNLDEEIRRIDQKLNERGLRKIKLVPVLATRPGDLIDKLNKHKPKVVQFSGHGVRGGENHGPGRVGTRDGSRDMIQTGAEEEGRILVIGEDGKAKPVAKSDLVDLFRHRGDVVQIVVLNACFTCGQAEAIAEHIDCVIGTTRDIVDEAARIFAARLYRSLAACSSVATAFAEARSELGLQGLRDEASIPQLLTRRGVDAREVYLFPPKTKSPQPGRESPPSEPTRGSAAVPPRSVPAHPPGPSPPVGTDLPGPKVDMPTADDASEFDPRIEEVATAIRAKLNHIKDCELLDKNDQRILALKLVWDELKCGAPATGRTLIEHVATFLTARRLDQDIVGLVRVIRPLYEQGKKYEAGRISEIVHLMLPLCLPQKLLAEAWQQLQGQEAVLIRTSLTKKTGAEILMAGLHHKPVRFRKSSVEPSGERLVAYEGDPIGDPNWNVPSALRDLYAATFHPDVKENERGDVEIKLSIDAVREELKAHYAFLKGLEEMPCYCVLKLAATEADRNHQARLLKDLGIPDLIFLGLLSESDTIGFERYAVTCLNTLFEIEKRG
jgi:hypothetical protein